MRFMIIVKATKDSEAGVMPTDALISEMADYHQQLTDAGLLLDASGLQPSAKGNHVCRGTLRRGQGTRGRLHDHSDNIPGGSHRVDQTLSQSLP